MKTPQNWLESVDFDWDEQVSVRMIEAIQQDAFNSGWLQGMEDAKDIVSKDWTATPPTKTTEK